MKKLSILFFIFLPAICLGQHPFTDFEPENIGKTINSEFVEMFPMVMSDGLTLYFSSDRPGGHGDLDIYVTTRKTKSDPWAKPVNLGSDINSKYSDHSVTVSEDGHWMVFTSERKEGKGLGDLLISYREDISDPIGWQKPENISGPVNSTMYEACPLFQAEDKLKKVYFVRTKTPELSTFDLYVSKMDSSNNLSEPVLLEKLSSPKGDFHFDPASGLIWSSRKGGEGKTDLWITTDRIDEFTWADPINLGNNINTSYKEGMPSVTHDESILIFHSDRPGGYGKMDIYYAID